MYMFSLRDFRFFTYIVENRLTVLKVILSCIFSTAIGGFLVAALRRMCRRTLEIEKLAALCYILPIAVYVILNFTVVFNMCDRVVADGFSFGIAIGIILNLLRKPTGEYTARLELKGLSANISSGTWLSEVLIDWSCLEDYYSILLLSYSLSSGVLGSPVYDSIIAHHHHTNNNPSFNP